MSRASCNRSRIPTILITGRNDEMTRRLVESEAIAVLFKPIDEVPLLEAIARCLSLLADDTA